MAALDEIGISRPAEIMLAVVINMCRVLSVIPFIILLAVWIPIAMSPWLVLGLWRVLKNIGKTRGIVARYRLERDLNG